MDYTILAERVSSLERKNRFLAILLISALVLIFVGGGRGNVAQTTLSSNRLLIRDDQNIVRMELGIANNQPFIAMNDAQGKRRVDLSLDPINGDGASLKFLAGNGNALLELWGSEEGSALNFSDKSGKMWLLLQTAYDKGGRQIALLTPTADGKSAATTGFTIADNGDASATLSNNNKGIVDIELNKGGLPDLQMNSAVGLGGIDARVDAAGMPHVTMTRKDGVVVFEKP